MLATGMAHTPYLIIMDEPTNHLDLPSIECLESALMDCPSALLLVSHDRAFLNRVVTSTIVFEGNNQINEYVGGYDDWLRQRPQPESGLKIKEQAKEKPKKERARKLTFKEKRELEELPLQIDALETEIAALHAKMADPDFYRTAGGQVATTTTRLETIEAELAETYVRWEELAALGD